jgi:hypothetical protein
VTALSNLNLDSRSTWFAVQYAAAADKAQPMANTIIAVEAWLAILGNCFESMLGPLGSLGNVL